MAEGQEVLAPQYGDELLGGHGGLDNGDGHRAEAYGNYENREGDAGAGGEKSAEESTEGKVFVGGVSWQTTEDGLRYYFGKYGEISDVLLMKDKNTGAPRGFGFVVFKNPAVIDTVIGQEHNIDGRNVEVKRAVPRDQAPAPTRGGLSKPLETKKIFVGGLAATVTEDAFRSYFEKFGRITDAVVMMDRTTQRSRGFGFVTYEQEFSVRDVLRERHELDGKAVEVKRAEPKGDPRGGGYGGYGAGYGGYGGGYGGRGGGYGAGYGGRGGGAQGYGSGYGGGYGAGYGQRGYGQGADAGYGRGYSGGYGAGYGGGYGGSTASQGYGSGPAGAGYGGASGGYAGGYGTGATAGYGGATQGYGGSGGGAYAGYGGQTATTGYSTAAYGGQSQDSSYNQTGYGGYRGQQTAQGRADRSYRPY